MKLNDKLYDVLKWITMVLLPALSALYWALADVWNLPYAQQVTGTIMAVTAFLGVLLGISTAQYNKTQPIDLFNIQQNVESNAQLGGEIENVYGEETATTEVGSDLEQPE